MNYRYGFELEGFYQTPTGISIPPENMPHDGFPGLIEFRTTGHHTLKDAWASIIQQFLDYDLNNLNFKTCIHTFSTTEKRQLRKRHSHKEPWDIQNIYNKKPKALGNKTIASLQINISNLVRGSYTDGDNKYHPDVFGLLDVPRIVKALDKTFAVYIKDSNRQPGEYCIKGNRLEYRSLPNSIFPRDLSVQPQAFLDAIKKAVEGE